MILIVVLVNFIVLSMASPPTFANRFSGVFVRNESFYGPEGTLSNHEVIVNLPDKRAYISIVPQGKSGDIDAGEFWLIFAPQNAEPRTKQASSYVVFAAKSAADGTEYCSYSTLADWSAGILSPPGKFPPQWINTDGTPTMNNWFAFPPNMNSVGKSSWRNIPVDRWDSSDNCAVFGQTPTPCVRIATKQGTNTPVAVQFAHQKKPHSFESDWLSFDWWTEYQTSDIPDITPPTEQWTSTCYNSENGVIVDPERGFVSTPDGMDNFTLSLSDNGRPITSLGDVRVSFQTSGPAQPRVQFLLENGANANTLVFNANNYKNPVKIFVKYLRDGETYFTVVATGGGYDIPYILTQGQRQAQRETRSSSFRVVTCLHGTVGYGCS